MADYSRQMEPNNEMISVIIPASKDYQDKYLKECLSSIPDNCEPIIETWEIGKEKWTDSINRGINKATGEYIMVLGIDDKLHNGIIDKLEKIIDGETDIYYGQLEFFGGRNGVMTPNKNFTVEDIKKNNQMYVTSLCRKQAVLDVGVVS